MGEIIQDPVSIPKGLMSDFTDFLKKCLNKDERDRYGADQLLEHPWIKHRLDHNFMIQKPAILHDVPDTDLIPHTENISDGEGKPDGFEMEKSLPFNWIGSSAQSRLQSEFSLICNLGKGGFGEVYKVKNNLDSQIYAIKRIKLDQKNKQLTRKLRREVELLSRLNHEVRPFYFYEIHYLNLTQLFKEIFSTCFIVTHTVILKGIYYYLVIIGLIK